MNINGQETEERRKNERTRDIRHEYRGTIRKTKQEKNARDSTEEN